MRVNECRYSVSISPNPKLQGPAVYVCVTPAETERNDLASYQLGSVSNGNKLENRYVKLISNLKMMDEEVQRSLG